MITVLADKFLYKIADFLPDDADLTLFDPAEPLQKIPEETDALLIRTVTKINPQSLPSLPKNLSFVGTGSVGTDHVDMDYLKQNGIIFANAAGCNARSVAEYVTVSLLLWAEETGADLSNLQVGIIGAGHTGSEVKKIVQKLGLKTVTYDPPRGEREPGFQSATLNEVLQSDVLSFHVPLTRQTNHPTFHWLDEEKLARHSFLLVINAARGGVVDEHALLEACRAGTVKNYILDVWENEPRFSDEVARHAFTKTPHIAGYSVQAKARASKMIGEALARHFSLPPKGLPSLQSMASPQKEAPPTFWSLTDVLTHYHPLRDYETRFNMLIGRSDQSKKEGFQQIRSTHPLRHEFNYLPIEEKLRHKFNVLDKIIEL